MTSFFEKNEHVIDRGIRIVVGLGVLSLAFVGPKTPWGYIGILPILTGASGRCPMYALFGFSTCPVASRKTT